MSRSFIKLGLVLLMVGVLPFAASLVIVNDLFSQAVSVGLNPEVQARLEGSAEAHRQLFEIEKLSHELAAERVANDPDWLDDVEVDDERLRSAYTLILERHRHVHPRLVELWVARAGEQNRLGNVIAAPATGEMTRDEVRTVQTPAGPVNVTLSFGLPRRFEAELEQLGGTLRTFRALETLEDDLARGMRRTYLYFGGGVAILALLVGALLTRRTTRRIARIAEAADRVGKGDLTVRVAALGHDEIGDLSREFNHMVEALQTSQDRLAYLQRVSAWQGIARRLAHEIKNPLTPILLAMQQLDKGFERHRDQPERFRPMLSEALEIVQEEIETLRTLVREFSDFGRLPRVSPEPVEVATFLEDFVKTNPQHSQRASFELVIEEGARSLRANLDTTLLRRALVNLVDNAIDAGTERHGEDADAVRVSMTLSRREARAVISIEDNGAGIEVERLERVFEPYFTTKEGGTGLGLPIVKKIVLDHGGWVTFENRDHGRGARVAISLPAE